jgi:phosphoglycolate phosphatase-like HAD superfamily hydrolase
VTLLPADVAIAVLDYHDLDIGKEIDVVVGRDPLIRPKPEPDGVLEACRVLGVEPTSAVMIGDSTWDAQAAIAAGADFIGVPADGFDEQMRMRTKTSKSMAGALALLGPKG